MEKTVIKSGMIYNISIWLLPVLIAITFHEAAHGFHPKLNRQHLSGSNEYFDRG